MKMTPRLGITIGIMMIMVGCAYLSPTMKAHKHLPISTPNISEGSKTQVQANYGKLPLYFIQNDGQVDKKVKPETCVKSV